MTRVRWLQAEFNRSQLEACAAALLRQQYNVESGQGHVLHSVRRDSISGEFHEVRVDDTVVRDVLGRELVSRQVQVRRFSYLLTTERPGIEAHDVGRGFRSAMRPVLDVCGETFSVERPRNILSAWVACLNDMVAGVEIRSAKVADITMSASVSADVSLYGSGNIARALKKTLADAKTGRLAEVELAWPCRNGKSANVRLYSGGAATVVPEAMEALPALRKSLSRALSA